MTIRTTSIPQDLTANVDEVTLTYTGGKLAIKDGGVDTTQLADDAVLTGKIAADAVETADIKDSNVTAAKILDGTISTAKLDFATFAEVGSTVLASAATSIGFSSLDLDADKVYIVVFAFLNDYAGTTSISVEFNSDTTATNYNRQTVNYEGVNVTAAAQNNNRATILDANDSLSAGFGIIYNNADGIAVGHFYSDGAGAAQTNPEFYNSMVRWTNSANVTSIDFTANNANSLDAGSYVRIYKVG